MFHPPPSHEKGVKVVLIAPVLFAAATGIYIHRRNGQCGGNVTTLHDTFAYLFCVRSCAVQNHVWSPHVFAANCENHCKKSRAGYFSPTVQNMYDVNKVNKYLSAAAITINNISNVPKCMLQFIANTTLHPSSVILILTQNVYIFSSVI